MGLVAMYRSLYKSYLECDKQEVYIFISAKSCTKAGLLFHPITHVLIVSLRRFVQSQYLSYCKLKLRE